MFQYTSNGVLDKLFDAEVEKQIQTFPSYAQDRFRSEMKLIYDIMLRMLYVSIVIEISKYNVTFRIYDISRSIGRV